MTKRMLSIAFLLCLSISVLANKSNPDIFIDNNFKPHNFSYSAYKPNYINKKNSIAQNHEESKKSWSPWRPGKKPGKWKKQLWEVSTQPQKRVRMQKSIH